MPRGTAASTVTIGFVGTGAIENTDYVDNVLSEWLAEHAKSGKARFLAPVTEDTSDEICSILDYAIEKEIPFETITNPKEALPKVLKKYKDEATKSHAVEDPTAHLIKLLGEAGQNSHLAILWDQELGDEMETIANMAMDASVKPYDFIDGMVVLEGDEDGADDTTEAEAGTPAAEGEGEAVAYTQEELEGMGKDEVKAVAEGLGITKFPRSTAVLIEQIIEAQGLAEPEQEDEPLADAQDEDPEALAADTPLHEALTAVLQDHHTKLLDAVSEVIGQHSTNGSAPAATGPARGSKRAPATKEAAAAEEAPKRGRGRPAKAAAPVSTASRRSARRS